VLTLGVSPEGLYLASMFPLSMYAPSAACSVERDQGAQEEGLGVEYVTFADGTRTGNPFADSREAGGDVGESAGSYWPVEDR